MDGTLKKCILLVEDEAIIAMAEKRELERFGYTVILTNTGEKAIEMITITPHIDLILMDIDLGKGIDGTQAAELILKKGDFPILFLSSHMESEIVERTEKITSYGYVVKNSKITVLDASIKMAFKLFDAKIKMKEQDAALSANRETLKMILDTVPQSIFWKDRTGRYLGCNRTFAKAVGMDDPRGIEGLTDYDLHWPRGEADAYRADDRQVLELDMPKLHILEPLQQVDGTRSWVDTSKIPLHDPAGLPFGVLGVYEDITDRKKAEEELRANEKAKSDLLKKLNDAQRIALIGSWEWNLLTNEVWWSDETYRIYGETKGEYEPSFAENARFIHPDDIGRYAELFEHSVKTGEPLFYEVRLITHGGKLTHCVARGEVEYDDAGQPIRFTGTLQDVSERKLAEERIRRQLVEKDLLLTEIHHRMKNNIGSIVGLLTLQRDAVSSPEAAMILQEAIGRVESMRLIYDRLLIDRNYAAISTGEYLEAIIDSVVGFFPDHEEITCEKSIDDFPLDSRTMFSLGLVINELLTNIMKYGFTGADRKLVQIKLSRTGNHVALILQDRGRGYPEGFDQESPTGFGITLVKMLAQEIGGTFAATNEEGAKAVLEFDIS